MGIPVDEWQALCAYGRPAFDRCRCDPAPEQLGAGDVTDDGSLLMNDGALLEHGRAYLGESQMLAARYYGWQPLAQVGVNFTSGEAVYLVGRWPS